MNQRLAHVSPEELHKFAAHLKSFTERLTQDSQRLQGRFRDLGSSAWKDEVHDRFAQEFEQTMKVISKFIQHSEKHIPFLHKKARAVEEGYLRR